MVHQEGHMQPEMPFLNYSIFSLTTSISFISENVSLQTCISKVLFNNECPCMLGTNYKN